jgi:ornithine cyclodeaminase/alanine dehydrogenase-like protein (mu-crystallin family)
MPVPDAVLYLTEAEVQRTLSMTEALELAARGIQADGAGDVVGDKFYMPVGQGGFIKPFSGYLAGEELAYVKTFSFFPDNPVRFGCPPTSSMVLLFDAETGLPVCLMEAAWITALKTGASTAVTAARLARADSDVVTIFGAGTLGRMHLRALSQSFALRKAYVVDILPDVAQAYAAQLGTELRLPVQPIRLEERRQVVEESDIVVTVTTGSQPLVERTWLRPGTFVARLGSYQELALDVITTADKVVVDNWHYVRPRIPELEMLGQEERFGATDVHAEWPDIVAGRRPGRESPTEIIVYIALGLWGEYAAILPEVYRRARAQGIGTWLPRH